MDLGFERCAERYIRNMPAFSRAELERVQRAKVCIVGCGGLGGYVASTLARFGVLHLTLVDGDSFSASNLNRQLFATEATLGQLKVEAAKRFLTEINSRATVQAIAAMLAPDNAVQLLQGHDLVIDCLDKRAARHILNDACADLNIPYVHGATSGFYGQVANVFPGDSILKTIYTFSNSEAENSNQLGNPSFMPQLVAAIQCSEAVKILSGRADVMRHSLLYIDLLCNTMEVIRLEA